MLYQLQIRGARVIDPLRNIDRVEDIFIQNSKIVHAPPDGDFAVEEIVDAKGCIVTPGLIDFHTHLAYRTSEAGLNPDIYFLPSGITAAVDAGTAGTSNFEGMVHNVIAASTITVKSYMLISPVGLTTERYKENYDPAVFDTQRMSYLFERYPDSIMGFKVRVGKNFSMQRRYEPLRAAVELGERFGCPVCAHIVDPEDSLDEAMPYLRAGDVFTHCYQDHGPHTIMDGSGKIRASVLAARRRGVVFDTASGGRGRSIPMVKRAFAEGFYPDTISDDLVMQNVYRKWAFSLLRPMTEHLCMGMPLMEVIRACTQTPAKLMGLENVIGTLAPGAQADAAILKIVEKPVHFADPMGNELEADKLFVPQMTIKAGRIMYRQIEFMF